MHTRVVHESLACIGDLHQLDCCTNTHPTLHSKPLHLSHKPQTARPLLFKQHQVHPERSSNPASALLKCPGHGVQSNSQRLCTTGRLTVRLCR